MAFDREAAKAEGYTDDEINAYLQAEAEKQKITEATPVVADVGEPPAPTTKINQVEGGFLSPSGGMSTAMATGLGAAGVGLPAAGVYVAKKILSPATSAGVDLAQRGVAAAEASAKTAAETEARIAANQAAKVAAAAPKPVAPTQLLDQFGRPITTSAGPVAPQPMTAPGPVAQGAQVAEQAAARAPSVLDKTTSMIRQLAANKVFQGLAKAGTAAQLATYSPELGPPVPQTGRMRGMEINPMTGRPWTPEQLKAYNANPAMYDSALGAAQMPR